MNERVHNFKVSMGLEIYSLFNFEGPRDCPDGQLSKLLLWSNFSKQEPLGEEGDTFRSEYGGVAQLGEHLLCKQGVIGSIPFISTRAGARSGKSRESEIRKLVA